MANKGYRYQANLARASEALKHTKKHIIDACFDRCDTDNPLKVSLCPDHELAYRIVSDIASYGENYQ